MTTFTEKVEELLTALTTHILENDIEADELMLKQAETAQALIAAHQAEISRVLERLEKEALTFHGIEHIGGVEVFDDGMDAVPLEAINKIKGEYSE